jgi:hypothetical protein
MPWQAVVFLAALIGIPIVVAWVIGGDKKAKKEKVKK